MPHLRRGTPPLPEVSVEAGPAAVPALVRLQRSMADWMIATASSAGVLRRAAARRPWVPYVESLALLGLITVFGLLIEDRVASTNVAMFYLLVVVVGALRWGRGPALLSSLVGAVAFDYFMIPPKMSFALTDAWYVITLLSMLTVGILTSTLASEARDQAEAARRSEESTAAMYAFSQSLAASSDLEAIVQAAGRHIFETFHWPALVAIAGDGGLTIRFRSPEFPEDADEEAAARWAFEHGETAGRGTAHVACAQGHYLPLKTAWGIKGVLGVAFGEAQSRFAARHHPLLDVFVSRAALAIGRAILEETARRAELLSRTDRMQKALLNSISHNLRTPLATVTGALQTLLQDHAVLDEATRLELLTNAEEQAGRLNRLVGNLLDMTRLEAGAVRVKREPCDLLDVIGAALDQLGEAARRRQIRLDLPPRQLLVPLDFGLISQVMVNLLDNALKYSPPDEPVEIRVRDTGDDLEVLVLDRGVGIAEPELELIFDRFQRGSRSGQAAGSGLGLSICRGFVEAHGGRIWAERRMPVGSILAFTIPMREKPVTVRKAEDERAGTTSPRH